MQIFFILFISLFSFAAVSQSQSIQVAVNTVNSNNNLIYNGLDSLSDQDRTSFLVALSYFPELCSTRIQLKYKKIRTTLNVRPTIGSLIFNKRENRKYIIRINSSIKDSVITLDELNSDAQVGVLSHELSHIVDYRMRNIWGVISRGFTYMSKRGKSRYEREIDGIVIKHGLGCELYQWSSYVLQGSDASYKYKLFKSNIYMRPDEIRDLENAERSTSR